MSCFSSLEFVSVIVLSLTSASDMFNVNKKPDLAGGHALQNTAWEKRLHITRELTLSKGIWESHFDICICDASTFRREQVDPVVLNIFSGDAWLNNLIPLTWQTAISYRLYEKVPLSAFSPLVITLSCATHYHLVSHSFSRMISCDTKVWKNTIYTHNKHSLATLLVHVYNWMLSNTTYLQKVLHLGGL